MDRDELILQKLTELSTELKEVRTELKEVRAEFSTDLKDIRTELKETRTELFTELKEVRAEFSTDLKDIRIEFSTKLANVQKFVDRIQQDVGDVKLRQADFRMTLKQQIRNWQGTSRDWKLKSMVLPLQ